MLHRSLLPLLPRAPWLSPATAAGVAIAVGCLASFSVAAQPAYGSCSAVAPLPQRRDLPSLVPGDRGADVRALQTLLTLLGDYDGAIDGVFSESVTAAVKQFQARADLPPTGQVTTDTWAKLLPHRSTSETCLEAP